MDSLADSSDDDLLFEAGTIFEPRKPYKFRVRKILDTAENCDDEEFRSIYRMSRERFEYVIEMVKDYYPIQGQSNNGKSLSPREKLYIFLFFIASGVRG